MILVNMLIILLSDEYEKLSNSVIASHRSTLIRYYKRYKWDKKYGYIMFLATPFNIINYLIIPFHLFFEKKNKNKSIKNILKNVNIDMSNSDSDILTKSITNDDNLDLKEDNENNKSDNNRDKIKNDPNKKEDTFNLIVTGCHFLFFYFPFIFIIEASLSILFIPFAYLFGIFCTIKNKGNLTKNISQVFIFLLWLIVGIPFLIFNYLIDLFFLCSTIFNNFNQEELNEKKRIKDLITTKEIEKFMQFIHSRETKDKEDLQTLFRNFLLWENEKLDKNTRRYSNYLNRVSHIGETKTKNINIALIGLNNKSLRKNTKKNNSSSFSLVFSSRIYKRNLIIIEILQNFLIDNDYFIVDIEKMKMILPYTMNINNDYIKTLIFTNISNIQRALNKKKKKENTFIESKTLNRMAGAIIRLNKAFDGDNTDPLKDEDKKKKNKLDLDDNEDNFYTNYNKILTEMTQELKETILKMEYISKENEMNHRINNKMI